ncbi:MAG: CCA tRNA nucleotidyltransferase [Candidatus Aenigmarchaeota archaeon]|nr:CCA tRNA nucleotidyltransferase [Candidatus Aenigmarchaeota archaeon]
MPLQKVLARIKPSQKEIDEVHKFLGRLEDETRKLGCEGLAAGSIGKHTWLKGDHDIDWFLMFPKETSRELLEKEGLAIGRKLAKALRGKIQIKYAEHPYTRILFKKYHIDVVPCYKIEKGERIISAVDRSPLHLAFINEKMPAKAQDDVRLLKQFLKGTHVYGSDLRRSGFSGYIAELLVIKYGSFADTIKNAAKWKPGLVINMGASRISKLEKVPLTIIDPVDEKRNVAAALNEENFLRFVSVCNQFLKKPSLDHFFPKDLALKGVEIKNLQSRGTYWFAFVGKAPDVIDDILWPQMRRASERIGNLLKKNDFEIYTKGVFAGKKMTLWFELEEGQKPHAEKMTGPPIYAKNNFTQFLEKYSDSEFGIAVEEDKVVAYRRRPMQKASEIKTISKKPLEWMQQNGIPGNIASSLRKGRFTEQKKFWRFVRKNKELSRYMRRKYFETALSL